MAARQVAFCIPWFNFAGGPTLAIYWYGILASVGIFAGAFYASKHLEMEGDDPDLVWDALLWVLLGGLVGARLWYVLAEVLGGNAQGFTLTDPLTIINPRGGGMNIFGGALGGLIAILLYARRRKINGWLLVDAGLMGLLIGQGIGRIGNWVNIELYGPPTGSSWFGMIVPSDYRIAQFRDLTLYPPDTRFHPTMFYEMIWLFVVFGLLYYLFQRYQRDIVHGIMAGSYLVLAGFGRFILEFWRPDQPLLPNSPISYSRIFAMVYVVVGIIILLDRTGYLRIPFTERPPTQKQRHEAFDEIMRTRRRVERARERERLREERRKARIEARQHESAEARPADSGESQE